MSSVGARMGFWLDMIRYCHNIVLCACGAHYYIVDDISKRKPRVWRSSSRQVYYTSVLLLILIVSFPLFFYHLLVFRHRRDAAPVLSDLSSYTSEVYAHDLF